MDEIYLASHAQWRDWLERNHRSSAGVWLVLYRKGSGKPSPGYDEAVEEALCFGWVTLAKRSETGRRRVEKAIRLLEQGKRLGLK